MQSPQSVKNRSLPRRPEREGVVAILQDQPTLERVQGIIRELHLEDELSLEATLDSARQRVRDRHNSILLT